MPSKTIAAMVCLTAITITCIFKNIDGVLVGTVCTLIGGLGGFAYAKYKKP